MDSFMYIFNPENDMALANNTIYYKAPREIIRMADDLCLLPAWYAERNAMVKVTDKKLNTSLITDYVARGVDLDVDLTEEFANADYMPWGWSAALIHQLNVHGVSATCCPDEHQMERIRTLSGRQTCVDVLSRFDRLENICGQTVVCSSLEEVESLVSKNGRSIVKSPWSGSGRGLMKVDYVPMDRNLEGWVSRILRTQGTVMVEPLYNKVVDFAMEFYSGTDGVRFCGYSMFETDDLGNYKCNVLASNEWMENQLFCYVTARQLSVIRDTLIEWFNSCLPGVYQGYLGVDMMVCLHDGGYVVHPCVEINLRMNMGVASRIIFDRYVCHDVIGKYVVEHFFSDGEAVSFQREMQTKYPSIIRDGSFVSGYFPLTPVQLTTRFHIYLLIL